MDCKVRAMLVYLNNTVAYSSVQASKVRLMVASGSARCRASCASVPLRAWSAMAITRSRNVLRAGRS